VNRLFHLNQYNKADDVVMRELNTVTQFKVQPKKERQTIEEPRSGVQDTTVDYWH